MTWMAFPVTSPQSDVTFQYKHLVTLTFLGLSLLICRMWQHEFNNGLLGIPDDSVVKSPPLNEGDMWSIPRPGGSHRLQSN